MAFGAGEGDVEEAFFLFDLAFAFGVVAGEFVVGHAGDEDGVEFEAFGLVNGEDGDATVVEREEIEVPGEGDLPGEVGEHIGGWAGPGRRGRGRIGRGAGVLPGNDRRGRSP